MTIDLIKLAQEGDEEATLKLISKFEPLLKKYAYELRDDDSYNQILVEFLQLVKKMNLNSFRDVSEGTIVSYISKSIHPLQCSTALGEGL